MPPKPLLLATRSFPTRGAAQQFYRDILYQYRPGDRVSDAHAADLLAVLDRHPEYEQKVGCGIAHFEVMMTPQGTPCFRIVRVDKTGTDFSFYWAIKGEPPSRKHEVLTAFRAAVADDVAAIRGELIGKSLVGPGLVRCAVSGVSIPIAEAHVDHRPPHTFEALVLRFLAERGLVIPAVPITEGRDEQTITEITDAVLAENFRSFHTAAAVLELVHKPINLAQSSKHRVRG